MGKPHACVPHGANTWKHPAALLFLFGRTGLIQVRQAFLQAGDLPLQPFDALTNTLVTKVLLGTVGCLPTDFRVM